MFALLVFALQFFRLWVATVHAQGTNVVCLPEYSWMMNSLGQNPCLVASWLWTPCTGLGNASAINKLPPGFVYGGPHSKSVFESTSCKCNTVVYSVIAACGVCQTQSSVEKSFEPWPIYSNNCTKTFNATFPEPIPNETAIPEWAFLDVISNSNFNVEAAKSAAEQGLPDTRSESSTAPSSTRPSNVTTTPTLTLDQNGTPNTTQTSPPAKQTARNKEDVIRGVLGGIIGLLLVGTLFLYIIRRRRRQTCKDPSLSGSQAREVREIPGPATPGYHVQTLKGNTGSVKGLRVYDPNDPRTYPTAQAKGTGYIGLPQVMSGV